MQEAEWERAKGHLRAMHAIMGHRRLLVGSGYADKCLTQFEEFGEALDMFIKIVEEDEMHNKAFPS